MSETQNENQTPGHVPVVALVGRPNVGKSRLFNRIVGHRAAIVEDTPGVTRDRHYERTEWYDRPYDLIDTGGFEPESVDAMLEQMREQAQVAIEEADIIVQVVDGKAGLLPGDSLITEVLRRADKPIFIAVNKLDVLAQADDSAEFYALGWENVFPISAEHGVGLDDLMDAVTADFLRIEALHLVRDARATYVAVVGKPNAGKSTLINYLLGEDRLLTSEIAGTTRDAIDTQVLREDGSRYVLIDTAGMRRKRSVTRRLEQYSVFKAVQSIERADVVLLLIDALEGVTDQVAKIAHLAVSRGAALAFLLNKWDVVERKETNTAAEFTRAIYEKLPFADFAPVVTISAKTGQRAHLILDLVDRLRAAAALRVGTGELNRVFEEISMRHQPPSVRGRTTRFYYISQVGTSPPKFVLQTNAPKAVTPAYRRYVERQLRAVYGFEGAPIRLLVRQPAGRHKWDDKK